MKKIFQISFLLIISIFLFVSCQSIQQDQAVGKKVLLDTNNITIDSIQIVEGTRLELNKYYLANEMYRILIFENRKIDFDKNRKYEIIRTVCDNIYHGNVLIINFRIDGFERIYKIRVNENDKCIEVSDRDNAILDRLFIFKKKVVRSKYIYTLELEKTIINRNCPYDLADFYIYTNNDEVLRKSETILLDYMKNNLSDFNAFCAILTIMQYYSAINDDEKYAKYEIQANKLLDKGTLPETFINLLNYTTIPRDIYKAR